LARGIALDLGPAQLEKLVRSQPFVDVKAESVYMPHGLWTQGSIFSFKDILIHMKIWKERLSDHTAYAYLINQ